MKKNRQSRAVEGLEPGTNYVYQVGDGTIWSETLEFTTTAVASKLSFFVLADLQAYSNNITDISEGGTVWLSGDGHCTFCGLLSFMYARHFLRSDCRRCAKPLVGCRALSIRLIEFQFRDIYKIFQVERV